MRRFILGNRFESEGGFGPTETLSEEDLRTHLLVLGATGSGKSRWLRKLCQDHLFAGHGIAVLDVHGDTAEDLLGDVAKWVVERGSKAILHRTHYVEFAPGLCPRMDPFRFQPDEHLHPELRTNALRAWLTAQADLYGSVLQAKQGYSDFESQPRLQRVLRNVLIACGTEVNGKRIPMGAATILLDLTHPLHQQVYDRLAPLLSREVRADFETLHRFRRMEEVRTETESTLNRLRSFFSPLVAASMSAGDEALDLKHVIQNGHALLVNLRKSPYFSHDQGVGIGKLFIHNLISTMETMPREKRRPFTLVIEEAGELLSDEIQRALGAVRKYGCRIILCGQDLSTFQKKDLDLVPKILSQCGTILSFSQKYPDDVELLSRVLFTGNLDFTPLIHEAERHGGYDWLRIQETSHSQQVSHSTSGQVGVQQSHSTSEQESRSASRQKGMTRSKNWQQSDGASTTMGQSLGKTEGQSRQFPLDRSRSQLPPITQQQSEARAQQQSQTDTTSRSLGAGIGESETVGQTIGRSRGSSTTLGASAQMGWGDSESSGETTTEKFVHLAHVIREKQRTGQLEQSISDQMEKHRQMLAGLPQRHAIVSKKGAPAVQIVTPTVPDPFASADALVLALRWIKRELTQIHPYLFVPNLDLAEEDRCLLEFLNDDESVEQLRQTVAMMQMNEPGNGEPTKKIHLIENRS